MPVPKRGIKEGGNQVKVEKQQHGTLSPAKIAPNLREMIVITFNDYGLKSP